jgi:hypothetical protein
VSEENLQTNSQEVGLTINEKETKYLKCTRKDNKSESSNININGSRIKQVNQYKYVGSITRAIQ